MIEKAIIARQPGAPPRGRISVLPNRTGPVWRPALRIGPSRRQPLMVARASVWCFLAPNWLEKILRTMPSGSMT